MNLLFIMVCLVIGIVEGETTVGFYAKTCPQAETIVRTTVESHFSKNPAIAPGLLRMHFHDCFVRGCDASVLITGPNTESTAPPNLSLRGFEVIDEAKAKLEAACPNVVSCADILALAARDSVVLTKGIYWPVPTGRRDGRISIASEANTLPGPAESVDSQKQKFSAKGLDTKEMVTLVGGHTIGTAQCLLFSYRLYNFNNTGKPDPSMDPTILPQLQALCPQNGNGSVRVALDTGSEDKFDISYYENLKDGRGILESDQKLYMDPTTKPVVQGYLGVFGFLGWTFNVEFGKAMIKMGNIGVKNSTDGEIRKVCSVIN